MFAVNRKTALVASLSALSILGCERRESVPPVTSVQRIIDADVPGWTTTRDKTGEAHRFKFPPETTKVWGYASFGSDPRLVTYSDGEKQVFREIRLKSSEFAETNTIFLISATCPENIKQWFGGTPNKLIELQNPTGRVVIEGNLHIWRGDKILTNFKLYQGAETGKFLLLEN